MSEEKSGVLFDSIQYKSIEELNKFIDDINREQAYYCIIRSCVSAIKRNTYSLEETEVLLKSMRTLSSSPTEEDESKD